MLIAVATQPGEGASWQLATHRHCAYYSQADKAVTIGSSEDANPGKPGLQNPGTPVLDASDPTRRHDPPGPGTRPARTAADA